MKPEFVNGLVRDWYDPLFRFAVSLSGNRDDALDLTQNAFLKLSRNADRIREPAKAKSWLFQTVHREYIDQYRRNRRRPEHPLEAAAEPAAATESPGRSIDAARLREVLEVLEERFRAPLALFYLQQLSYREIAEALDIPVGTVMSRLRRGKDRLRALLEAGETGKTGASGPIPFPGRQSRHG